MRTSCCSPLGTSIPTEFFPGIGATIRTLGTRKAIAISSLRLVILLSRKPASNSISYCAITGPVSISTTLTLKPNSLNVFSKIRAFCRTSLSWDSKSIIARRSSNWLLGTSYPANWSAIVDADSKDSINCSRSVFSSSNGGADLPITLAGVADRIGVSARLRSCSARPVFFFI